MLEDIAILTGGEVIATDLDLDLKDVSIEQLGRARQVKVQKENTIIVDGMGDKEELKKRVSQVRKILEDTLSEYEKENLEERLAKLVGGVAVIQVGAATEIEMKEKKLRIEDALSATKAAVEKVVEDLIGGEKLGATIILKALEEPVKHCLNSTD